MIHRPLVPVGAGMPTMSVPPPPPGASYPYICGDMRNDPVKATFSFENKVTVFCEFCMIL
jgi:hypothetical protein